MRMERCSTSPTLDDFVESFRDKKPICVYQMRVVDGFYVETVSGVVRGRCLELDANVNNFFSPLYSYNRSWRFVGLFSQYKINIYEQRVTLQAFEALEKVWENEKQNYTRVYFLTQKLILQEITQRLGIATTQPTARPISDLKRYNAQLRIFNNLWKICIINKLCPNYTSETNKHFLNSNQTVSCH